MTIQYNKGKKDTERALPLLLFLFLVDINLPNLIPNKNWILVTLRLDDSLTNNC